MKGRTVRGMMKRRAISPIVATLILIVIAVVAAVAVFGFIQGFVAQTTTNSQAPSSIVVDAACVDSSTVKFVVRNVGTTDAKITAVYVLAPSDLHLLASSTFSSTPVSSGSVTSFSVGGLSITASGYVIVKVVTADGSSATYKVKVSGTCS